MGSTERRTRSIERKTGSTERRRSGSTEPRSRSVTPQRRGSDKGLGQSQQGGERRRRPRGRSAEPSERDQTRPDGQQQQQQQQQDQEGQRRERRTRSIERRTKSIERRTKSTERRGSTEPRSRSVTPQRRGSDEAAVRQSQQQGGERRRRPRGRSAEPAAEKEKQQTTTAAATSAGIAAFAAIAKTTTVDRPQVVTGSDKTTSESAFDGFVLERAADAAVAGIGLEQAEKTSKQAAAPPPPLRTQDEVVFRFAPILIREGIIHRKKLTSFIRKAVFGENVVTEIDGKQETQYHIDNDSSWIVCGKAAGERYVLTNEEFETNYAKEFAQEISPDSKYSLASRLRDEGFMEYPSRRRVWAHKVTEMDMLFFHHGIEGKNYNSTEGYFLAPWGESMLVQLGDYLVMQYPEVDNKEIYRIDRHVFRVSYVNDTEKQAAKKKKKKKKKTTPKRRASISGGELGAAPTPTKDDSLGKHIRRGSPKRQQTPSQYLVSKGLPQAEADAIIEAAGVSEMEDLAMFDDNLISDVAKKVGLKPISKKRLSIAVQEYAEALEYHSLQTDPGPSSNAVKKGFSKMGGGITKVGGLAFTATKKVVSGGTTKGSKKSSKTPLHASQTDLDDDVENPQPEPRLLM